LRDTPARRVSVLEAHGHERPHLVCS
jgi:hypothetical protein